jgi:hypothetical protein
MVKDWYGLHSGFTQDVERYDSIWVMVDWLMKVSHFVPVKTTYIGAKLGELYMEIIVCLHEVLMKIMSYRGP